MSRRLNVKFKAIEFAWVCVHFWPISGQIISPQNILEIEKIYTLSSNIQIFGKLFCVVHS